MIFHDFGHFGLRFLRHNFHRGEKGSTTVVPVPGIGNVHVRPDDSDIDTIRQVFGNKDYDMSYPALLANRISDHYTNLLHQGLTPIVVDAGANIGAATLWFSSKYPQASIIAIEPDPGNAAVLRKNLATKKNCIVLEAAIGAERGFVELSTGGASWAVTTNRAQVGVRTVTIEDAFAESDGNAPFIVKIDIEGFEKDLFSSNLDWLERVYIVVLEPHDWMFPGMNISRNFQRAMANHPFELFIKGENLFYVRV